MAMKPLMILMPLLLAGCAATVVKEAQVRSALVDAGLRPATADCMARPMAEQLSVEQLRRLRDARQLARSDFRDMTLGQVYDALRRSLDAETMSVVTRAGLRCVPLG